MAQCNFSIQVPVTGEEIVRKAETAIVNAGGSFRGDVQGGTFNVSTPLGTIRGSYTIEQPIVHIAIDAKPFLVSCSLIEKQLRTYFGQ